VGIRPINLSLDLDILVADADHYVPNQTKNRGVERLHPPEMICFFLSVRFVRDVFFAVNPQRKHLMIRIDWWV
jgi:hypothetical protein